MTTAPDSPEYVLQIDMWATVDSSGVTEHARAKYNTFKVKGEFYELEVKVKNQKSTLDFSDCTFSHIYRLEIMLKIHTLDLQVTC